MLFRPTFNDRLFEFLDKLHNGAYFAFAYILFRLIHFMISKGLKPQDKGCPLEQKDNEVVVHIIYSLRERARRLKLHARYILFSIALVIFLGLLFFYNPIEYNPRVEKLSYDYQERIDGLVREFEEHFERKEPAHIPESTYVTEDGLVIRTGRHEDSAEMARTRDSPNEDESPNFKLIKHMDEHYKKILELFEGELSEDYNARFMVELRSLVTRETDRVIAATQDINPFQITISTITARIGVVLFLFFLTHFLVTLYKYSIKLSVLYDSRADILQLLPKSESLSLEDLMKFTSTSNLDFSKSNKGTNDESMEIIKRIIDKS